MGREFGATTGRARRCGWFDAVATHYATMINGIDELAITNLDGLDEVNPISICIGYRLNGKRLDVPPCDSAQWNNCEPIYESMPGWSESTRSARKFADLPKRARDSINRTASNTGLTLVLALSYGGRDEIIDGIRSLLREVEAGHIDRAMINPEMFSKHLYTRYYPDPDLLIRTSGEMRISNFLLWQLSYTEMYVTPKLWPDFTRKDLFAAVDDFAKRQRRYGTV